MYADSILLKTNHLTGKSAGPAIYITFGMGFYISPGHNRNVFWRPQATNLPKTGKIARIRVPGEEERPRAVIHYEHYN
jgi:hypothetical protein